MEMYMDIKDIIGKVPYDLHYKCAGSLNCYYDSISPNTRENYKKSTLYSHKCKFISRNVFLILIVVFVIFIILFSKKMKL